MIAEEEIVMDGIPITLRVRFEKGFWLRIKVGMFLIAVLSRVWPGGITIEETEESDVVL